MERVGKLVLIGCTKQQKAGQRRKKKRNTNRRKMPMVGGNEGTMRKNDFVSFFFLFSRSCIATLFFRPFTEAKKARKQGVCMKWARQGVIFIPFLAGRSGERG